MMPNDPLLSRLEAARRELLDLSLRNPLLSYRPSKAQGLTIVREEAAAVFDVLVRQGKTMYFEAAPEPKPKAGAETTETLFPNEPAAIESERAEVRATALTDNKLATDEPLGRLESRLLNTLYTARTSLEETGVNILYLALGMLAWYEADASQEPRLAPLVLVPVTLERSAAGERFKLRYTGAEVEGNLSLQAKLKADFGLHLPLPEVDEESGLEPYYEAVAQAVRSQARWRVTVDAIALGFFSFAKLVMYADLDPAKWPAETPLADHPAVRALLGAETGFADAPPTVGEDAFLDTESTANELHQVLDADSSQLRALLAVVEGRNVVVQGPPGTGKSQTITNLIAEAIGAGKRVLFVAEKMAALEVVKRRLDNLGLGAACLELHSHKANKKALLEELKATLELGRPAAAAALQEQAAQLPRYREELNAYARAANAPIGRSRHSAQQVAGKLLALKEQTAGENLPRVEFGRLGEWTDDTATRAFAAADRLAATLQRVGCPKEQLFWGSELTVVLPADETALTENLRTAEQALAVLTTSANAVASLLLHLPAPADRAAAEALLPAGRQAHREALVAHQPAHAAAIRGAEEAAAALAHQLGLSAPADQPEAETVLAAARHARQAPPLAGVNVADSAWRDQQPLLRELREAGAQYRAAHAQFDQLLLADAWDQQLHTERGALLTHGGKWWNFLIGDYRRARNRLQGLWRGPLPKDNTQLTAAIDAIHDAARHRRTLREGGALGSRLFGSLWQNERSDWEALGRVIDFVTETHQRVQQRALPAEILTGLSDLRPEALADGIRHLEKALTAYHAASLSVGEVLPTRHPRVPALGPDWPTLPFDRQTQLLADWAAVTPAPDQLTAGLTALENALAGHRATLQQLADVLRLNEVRRFGPEGRLQFQTFAAQAELLAHWRTDLPQLQRTAEWNNVAQAARDGGFPELVALAERWPAAGQWLGAVTRQTWFEHLQRVAYEQFPALRQFERAGHETLIDRFRQADRDGLVHNRVRALLAHYENLPTQQAAGGQMLTLRNEFARKRGHMPIRKLMQQTGRAVQAIKPVFMMSPLSVANFLAPGTVAFDLVVFDEASQVKPVDAFGAIARGRQLVVVGDSKQLPPTSFFDTITSDGTPTDKEETTNVTADIQSILEMVAARLHPSLSLMLRWHYRSRHESLIAPSNYLFYDSRLVIFPSPSGRGAIGLRYHHLPDTHYERGTTRTNPREAATVAEAVLHHARATPHLTLGVVAFSTAQRQAIQDALEKLRRRHPETEDFFNRHPHEPFFVKNLENVQGDERDVILISLGYGRTAEGYLAMNFGPLNGEGGERRLNVLITRARQRCEVFTNLTADDLDLARTSAKGVAALKTFLTYAQHGFLNENRETGRPMESPFEEAVHRALTARGYEVRPQVGSQGFFIDLAVVDPDQPGRYVLGVECDGAMYHSARSARDRDRLRQQVLEAVGWRLHRIWSTDWFRDPARETERVVRAIEAARLQAATPEPEAAPLPPAATTEPHVIEREEAAPAPATTIAQPYELARVSPSIAQGEFHLHTIGKMATWITEVVRVESPVHFDEVARRLAQAAGLNKVGARMRATIEGGVKQAVRLGAIRQEGDFLWLTGQTEAPIRDRTNAPDATRKLALVAPAEIAAAVRTVVRDSFGISRDSVAAPVLRLLGFARVTEEARAQVDGVVAGLVAGEAVREVGGVLQEA